MIKVTAHDTKGKLGARYTLPHESDIVPNCPDGWLEGHHDPETTYAVNGLPVARPDTPLPPTHTVPAEEDWTVGNMPAGTQVWIDGQDMGPSPPVLVLMFPEPGVWPVRVVPPFPYKEATCAVTVT